MINISELEASFWEAADQLRINSKLTGTEYSMTVLGLNFTASFRTYFDATPKLEDNGC